MSDHEDLKRAREGEKKRMTRDWQSSASAFGAGAVVDTIAQLVLGNVAWFQGAWWRPGLMALPEAAAGHALRYLQNGAGLGTLGLAGGRVSETLLAWVARRNEQLGQPQATGLGQGFNPHGFNASREMRAMSMGRGGNASRELNQVPVRQRVA